MKPIKVKIPKEIFKLPVQDALIEMLNLSREQAEKQYPDWEDDSHPGFSEEVKNFTLEVNK